MELEATLVDKLQKAMTKICEECGLVTGQSLYYQLLGKDPECSQCKNRNRMLYLPVKILLMKFTSSFGVSEAELLSRMKEDPAWDHIVETLFKRVRDGKGPEGVLRDSFPMVVEVDLDCEGKDVDVDHFVAVLQKYREQGAIGVRFHKQQPFTGQETDLIRTTKQKGYLVSLAVNLPTTIRIGGFADTVDHVDIVYKDENTFLSLAGSDIKTILGGTILKPISIRVEYDLRSPEAVEKAKQLSNVLAPEAIIILPKLPPGSPDKEEAFDQYARMIRSDELAPFVSVRDREFVRWLSKSPGAAVIEEPLMVVFRDDIEKWSLPPEDFLPVKSVFSLVPLHVGRSSGAFSYRLKEDELKP